MSAVDHMHKAKVIHRDIKLQNFMLDQNYNLIIIGTDKIKNFKINLIYRNIYDYNTKIKNFLIFLKLMIFTIVDILFLNYLS